MRCVSAVSSKGERKKAAKASKKKDKAESKAAVQRAAKFCHRL